MKTLLIIIVLYCMSVTHSIAQGHWIPVVMDNIMTFVSDESKPPQSSILLSSGQSQTGIVGRGTYKHYKIYAKAGDRVNVAVYNQNANSNLYVKVGSRASISNYDCKSENGGRTHSPISESCALAIDANTYVDIAVYAPAYGCDKSVKHTIMVQKKPNKTVQIGARTTVSTPLKKGTKFASPIGEGDRCTKAKPCSIQTAIGKLGSGDVLFLMGGTYHINKRLYINKKGTKEAPIIIESYPGSKAVLQQNPQYEDDAAIKLYRAAYISLRNIEIRNFNVFGIRVRESSHITIEGCDIHDNRKSGISLYGANDCIIRDNKSYNNQDYDIGNADGIQIEVIGSNALNKNNTIIHNTVYNNSDDGIDTIGAINTLIAYNITYNNRGRNGINGGVGNGIGIKACGEFSKGGTIEHNIAFGNHGNGFECNKNSGRNVTFKYNTAYKNGGYGFGVNKSDSQARFVQNISQGNMNPYERHGTSLKNSWDVGGGIEFINVDVDHPINQDFLRPVKGSVFEHMGVYANLPDVNSKAEAKIFLIGDSTVHNQCNVLSNGHGDFFELGWGDVLKNFAKRPENIFNEARSGASSRSYKMVHKERHDWKETKERIAQSDLRHGGYLLIQFGHNDEGTQENSHTEPGIGGSFYNELKSYIDEARAMGITPVLVTPVQRQYRVDTHREYASTIRNLAEYENVLLLDLAQKSLAEFKKYGSHQEIHQKFGYDDYTHFNPEGANTVAGWVKDLICEKRDTHYLYNHLCNQFR